MRCTMSVVIDVHPTWVLWEPFPTPILVFRRHPNSSRPDQNYFHSDRSPASLPSQEVNYRPEILTAALQHDPDLWVNGHLHHISPWTLQMGEMLSRRGVHGLPVEDVSRSISLSYNGLGSLAERSRILKNASKLVVKYGEESYLCMGKVFIIRFATATVVEKSIKLI